MDNSTISTSFIPKQTITPKIEPARREEGGVGLFTVLTFIILFLSLAMAGGSYAYKLYLVSHIYGPCQQTSQIQPNTDSLGLTGETDRKCGLYLSLEDMRRRLDSDRLARMERLDAKMKMATQVLNSHMSLVPLFDFLGTSTLKTVRFTKLATLNGEANLEGIASGYEDIAVESNVLNNMPEVSNVMFSDLNLDQKGNVVFKLKFKVDTARLKYVPITQVN